MTFTEQDLTNLSHLARIDIHDDEKAQMLHDMQAILGYVSEINDIEGALSHGNEEVYNVVREDAVTRSTGAHTDAILANAPKVTEGYVEVEQVLK